MKEAITDEHRRLGLLFEEARLAFRDRRPPTVVDAFEALRGALDTHFEQEDLLYYPTIATLRPDLAPEVHRIAEAHGEFRRRFGEIADALAAGSRLEARRRFEDLAEAFAQHEASEEDLLRSLETQIAASR